VWFQNRRAKWRKKENTKKGPGRPAHNAHPQSCSGDPMDPQEVKRREQERSERKRRKQEDRLKKLEDKRRQMQDGKHRSVKSKVGSEAGSDSDCSHSSAANHHSNNNSDDRMSSGLDSEEDVCARRKCPFSIDSLLEAPKVPRGRRPNSKYPRVQASKSVNTLGMGMVPLYPITQPVGFVVEQRAASPSFCDGDDEGSGSEDRFTSYSESMRLSHSHRKLYSADVCNSQTSPRNDSVVHTHEKDSVARSSHNDNGDQSPNVSYERGSTTPVQNSDTTKHALINLETCPQ
jgi:hypothetical protein